MVGVGVKEEGRRARQSSTHGRIDTEQFKLSIHTLRNKHKARTGEGWEGEREADCQPDLDCRGVIHLVGVFYVSKQVRVPKNSVSR